MKNFGVRNPMLTDPMCTSVRCNDGKGMEGHAL